MKCGKFYQTVEHYIGGAFAKYGRFISRHPWKCIFITIIVNGSLGVGMLRTESNIEVGDVYLPLGTQAREEKERIESIFPDKSDTKYQKLQAVELRYSALFYVKSKSGNLLNRTTLAEIKALSDLIQNITAQDSDGKTIRLPDICAKANSECVVDGDIFWDPDFLSAVDTNTVTYPLFTSSASGTQNYALNIGREVHLDNTGRYLAEVEYLKIEFIVQAVHKQEAIVWGKEFVTACESFTSDNIEIAYSHLDSLSQEIDKNVMSDTTLIAATFAIMITYACVATFSSRVTDQVGQRMWIGFGGILAAGLSIVASLGLCAAAGVSFVSIVGLMPFLIIGVGIDDMFIMLSGLSEAQTKMSVEDKLAETMRVSGVGITITSLTDLIAFLVGAFSNFIAVQNFCIYTGVAVAFCYLNNITLFAACLVIHERRVADNRHFATCRRIKTKEELKAEGNHSRCHVICCSGRPPLNRNEAESLLDKFPRWIVPKIVLNLPCKIIIIFLFLGYLAGAIYGCVYLKQGLVLSQLVTDDSYFYKFSEWEDDYFSNQVPVTYVITETLDYSDSAVQSEIYSLVSNVQASRYFDNDFEVNWLRSYTNSPFYASSNETEFIAGLLKFFDHPQYSRFENDVVIDTVNNKITASRVYLLSVLMKNNTISGELMLESREIADKSSLDCFPFCFMYIVFEQYVRILGQTLQSVGIALVAVFIVTCLFMPHPALVLFCTVAVTMIMAGVFGYMFYLDVALSAITMIHVIMSIGFSVDFTAHICHGYILSNEKTRDKRVNAAIDKTGAPIFHGAVSSLLGIIVIVGAKSYVFKTFAVVMSFVLLFGIAHSLLLLPVVLSWIGPRPMTSHSKKGKPKSDIRSISKADYSNGDISKHSHLNQAFDDKKYKLHYHYPRPNQYSNNVPLSHVNYNRNAKRYHMSQDTGLDDQWIWTEVK